MAAMNQSGGLPRPALHAILAAALLLLGLLGARAIVNSAPSAGRMENLPGPRVVPVETHVLRASEIPRTISVTGTLEAAGEAVLSSELGGRVTYVAEGLREGQFLGLGEVILRVDTSALEAEMAAQVTAVELSQSRLVAAEKDLVGARKSLVALEKQRELLLAEERRWMGLGERGQAEQARVDLARSQRLAADASVSEAARGIDAIDSSIIAARLEIRLAKDREALLKTRLGKAEVKAPFPGHFSAVQIPTVGSTLSPLAPFGSLLDSRALRLVTDVHEDDFPALSTRSQALAAPLSRPGTILEGRVTSLGARVDAVTRSVRVEALFPGASPFESRSNAALEPGIPSGTFVRVDLRGDPFHGALWVSEAWLTYRDGQAVAFVVAGMDREGRAIAERRDVEFLSGTHEGGRVVASGLEPGDRVITSSLPLLDDGAPIRWSSDEEDTEVPGSAGPHGDTGAPGGER